MNPRSRNREEAMEARRLGRIPDNGYFRPNAPFGSLTFLSLVGNNSRCHSDPAQGENPLPTTLRAVAPAHLARVTPAP